MRELKSKSLIGSIAVTVLFFFSSCSQTVYTYQNGTTYNDYEVATNYRVKSATNKRKVSYSKAPNWRKYNQQTKYKRYN